MSTEHIVFAVTAVIFLVVVALVGLAILVSLAQKARPGAKPVATLYPIPRAEQGTGLHTSLLDAVEVMKDQENKRREREKLRDKLFDMMQDTSPKA